MADAAWKKLNEKIKAKRTKTTKKDPAKNHQQGDQLTVQRLSAEVFNILSLSVSRLLLRSNSS